MLNLMFCYLNTKYKKKICPGGPWMGFCASSVGVCLKTTGDNMAASALKIGLTSEYSLSLYIL